MRLSHATISHTTVYGTVSVISSDPQCKDGIAHFTMIPLKPELDQKCGRYCFFLTRKVIKSPLFLIGKKYMNYFWKEIANEIKQFKHKYIF